MEEYLNQVIEQLGISIWVLAVIFIWAYAWKLLALWKAGRKNSPVWFVILALFNTIGILEILYIFVFSKMKKNNFKKKKRK
jgi:hypothetical protein